MAITDPRRWPPFKVTKKANETNCLVHAHKLFITVQFDQLRIMSGKLPKKITLALSWWTNFLIKAQRLL